MDSYSLTHNYHLSITPVLYSCLFKFETHFKSVSTKVKLNNYIIQKIKNGDR